MNIVKQTLRAAALSAALTGVATAQDVPLQEEKEIVIACRLPPEATWKSLPLLQRFKVKPTDQDYSYRLWLPRGYLADAEKRWPVLFIASPGGDARMGQMRDWIVRNGFIAVMLVESRNGPWGAVIGNFLAAHDDVVRRCRVQEGMKWATGFSGGARGASLFVQLRPGFSGLILQGAGGAQYPEGPQQAQYIFEDIRAAPWIAVAITMGNSDMNASETAKVLADFRSGQAEAFRFDGGHAWAPKAVFEPAADWVMKRVLQDGPPNPALKPVYLLQFRERAQAAQATTDPWTRYKHFGELQEFAKTRGLAAEPEARDLLARMNAEAPRWRGDPAVARQLQAAEALARLEQGGARMPPALRREQFKSFLTQYGGTDAAARAQQLLDALPENSPGPAPRPRR